MGLLQLGHDKPHTITPFAQAKDPLHRDPVRIVLAFLFRSSYRAASDYLERLSYGEYDVYRTLDVLAAECDFI